MESIFRPVRRQDRLLDTPEALTLLQTGEYGFLALSAPSGYGYGIPLSYVFEEKHLYFHCAPEGYKLEVIASNPRVSFCVVGTTRVIPAQYTTAYSSVHVFGHIQVVSDDQERLHALRLLVHKYSPEYTERAEKYIAGSFKRTAILRFDIEHLSGKCKKVRTETL